MAGKDPRWQRYAALAIFALLIGAGAVFRARLAADFWPPDRSFVGPNLLAALVQAALVVVVLALIWPPARRRIHRFMDRKLAGLHERIDSLHERHDAHSEHLERIGRSLVELHEKLDAQAPRTRKPR